MTFTELLTEIYAITGRSDLESMTKSAVKAATLKAHQTDFYSKDIYETPVQFDSTTYTHSLDIISLIPNYRALKYIRKYTVSDASSGDFISVITPEEVLDKYNRELTDVCYVAGRNIEIKSSTEFNTILVGCYVAPIVVEATYSSWIAELYPYAIVHEAARFIFGAIAMDTEKKSQESMVAEAYLQLKTNALADIGY